MPSTFTPLMKKIGADLIPSQSPGHSDSRPAAVILANHRVPQYGTMRLAILVLVAVAAGVSCANQTPGAQTDSVIWRKLGAWSGRGPMQTEPFISETGSLRLRWETSHE